jgi:GNAT superfamily N-acetyltransferase
MAPSQSTSFTVRQTTIDDLDLLVPLFDGYRQFYGKPSDVKVAYDFLFDRFEHQQSIIFVAEAADGTGLGFTQLFPSFSSVSAARIFVLNDLYVSAQARRLGAGAALLRAAADYARSVGAVYLSLSTAVDNEAAQALYLAEGWIRDDDYFVFNQNL